MNRRVVVGALRLKEALFFEMSSTQRATLVVKTARATQFAPTLGGPHRVAPMSHGTAGVAWLSLVLQGFFLQHTATLKAHTAGDLMYVTC
jgi:hypothetical protein